MDENFTVPWSNDQYHFCTRPRYVEIFCKMVGKMAGSWVRYNSRYVFTSSGMIEENINPIANVASNKTFVKLKNDNDEDIDVESVNIFAGK